MNGSVVALDFADILLNCLFGGLKNTLQEFPVK
mgnify:CR=1 FL=1